MYCPNPSGPLKGSLKSKFTVYLSVPRNSESNLYVDIKIQAPKMVANVVAEYSKSARAACKQCGNTIAKGSPRLGIITKAAGGFDMTRWHHLHCFKSKITAPEDIKGFSLLKASDQEALKNLVASTGKVSGDVLTAAADLHDDEASDHEALKNLVASTGKASGDVLTVAADLHDDEDSHEKHVSLVVDEMYADSQGNPKKHKLSEENDDHFLNVFSPSELKSRYKDAFLPSKWKAFQTVIVLGEDDGLQASEKIAAFDFDGCLVKTSLKRVGADAWSLQYPSVPERLQSYYNKGFKLVIFTNESNIDRWKNSRQKATDSKVGRLEGFIKRVKVPIQVFIACGIEGTSDPFRKPKPGMWRLMERHFNSGVTIDMEQSFYVGDAAGRINDHSEADIGFAKAVGLKFYVPEDIFTSDA